MLVSIARFAAPALSVAGVLLLAACVSREERASDRESLIDLGRGLRLCDEDCAAPLECICGACTLPCERDGECNPLGPEAHCRSDADPPRCQTAKGVCDVGCEDDGDCARLGQGYRCDSGSCRVPPPCFEGVGMPAVCTNGGFGAATSGLCFASMEDACRCACAGPFDECTAEKRVADRTPLVTPECTHPIGEHCQEQHPFEREAPLQSDLSGCAVEPGGGGACSLDVVAEVQAQCDEDDRPCPDPVRISHDAAICIAVAAGLPEGLQPALATLEYHGTFRRPIWSVRVTLHMEPASSGGHIMSIDARTGEVLETASWLVVA